MQFIQRERDIHELYPTSLLRNKHIYTLHKPVVCKKKFLFKEIYIRNTQTNG